MRGRQVPSRGEGGRIRRRERFAAGKDRGGQRKGNDNSRDYAEMRGVAFIRKREKEKKDALSEVYIRAKPPATAVLRVSIKRRAFKVCVTCQNIDM